MDEPYPQPDGMVTVLRLPEELRGAWPQPQELELRVADELVIYGLITNYSLAHMVLRCADPGCEGHCHPREYLRIEIEIAPHEAV